MLSDLLEVAGLVCLVVLGFMFGPRAGVGAAAGCLLFAGYALDGVHLNVRQVVDTRRTSIRAARARRRERRQQPKK